MRGRLIVVEGLDGTGKSTFSRELARRLGAEWGTTPGLELRKLRGAIEAQARGCFPAMHTFFAASVLAEAARVRPLLEAGRDVVLDRYWATTVAYASLEPDHLDLASCERGLLTVDRTWYLTLAEPERRRRLQDRGTTPGDRNTMVDAHRRRLEAAYCAELRRPLHGVVVSVDVSALAFGELWPGWRG